MARSAYTCLLEAAIRLDRVFHQLLLAAAIARWRLPAPFAVLGLRWPGKAGKAREIAEVAQCALQALRLPVQMLQFVMALHCNRLRQRFQHVAETLAPDPQAVPARSRKVFKVPPLADQPLSPSVEFASAIGIQRLGAVAAHSPFPAHQPGPAVDPVCHRHDQGLEPAGTQAAKQPAVVLRSAPIEIIADLAFR